VLFAPGLPRLYRSATAAEGAIWEKLGGPIAVRVLSYNAYARQALKDLFSVGAAELAFDVTTTDAAAR
jgi:hypothetical protein